jgi:hypothetical protein
MGRTRRNVVPDQLTVHQGQVVLRTEEGRELKRSEAQLVDMLRAELVPPLSACALPDGVKFFDWRPPLLVVVHQAPPHVRQLRWIAADSPAQFGDGVVYRKVRLSLPYSITFAVYQQQGEGLVLTHNNELYFRNEPLRSRDDRLGYPALLNLSRVVTPLREKAWVCTQYLDYDDAAGWVEQLQALLEHVWSGGFNLSSEHHEGASWFGLSKDIHPDLQSVEAWEDASLVNDAFALGVTWRPVPLSVAEVMDCIFEEGHSGPGNRPDLPGRFLNFAQKG